MKYVQYVSSVSIVYFEQANVTFVYFVGPDTYATKLHPYTPLYTFPFHKFLSEELLQKYQTTKSLNKTKERILRTRLKQLILIFSKCL